jgi:uncharacterized protein YraI
MQALTRILVAMVALGLSAGAAAAATGTTKTDLPLKAGPSAQSELLLNLPSGAVVNVERCGHGWCGVTWNSYAGYVRQSGIAFREVTATAGSPAIPVYPHYPYRAGHYPTPESYYDLPPYAALDPSYYRWRYFLTLREHNRYRYVPHVFHHADDAYAE